MPEASQRQAPADPLAAAGDHERLESVRAEVTHQLEHLPEAYLIGWRQRPDRVIGQESRPVLRRAVQNDANILIARLPGILHQRAAVFRRFESGEGSTSKNRGLGLAFCKLAVEAHGGTIWIEDGSPGAVFCLRFPDAD